MYDKIEKMIVTEVTHTFDDTNAVAVLIVLNNGFTSVGTSSDADCEDWRDDAKFHARHDAIKKLVKIAEIQQSRPLGIIDDDDDLTGKISEILVSSN